MKLERDLVRDILLKLEEDTGDPREWKDVQVPGFTREQVAYHIAKMGEAGLIEAHDLSSHSGYDWRASSLTYEGHEFLDTVRDGKVWKEAKRIADEARVSSIRVLIEAAKTVVKHELLKHGVHLP